ncbi:MAG: alginate export family protein [Flavobacteriales bacterium]
MFYQTKKNHFAKPLVLGFMLLSSIQVSKAQLSLSGELRPRTEYRHGVKSLALPEQDPAVFTSQRSRLNIEYQSKSYLMKLVFQDVRVWGNQSQLVGNQDFGNSIHEAWAKVFLDDKLALKFGRQEIAYDNQRIFGSVAWAQQGRSHDALVLEYKANPKLNIHLGGAFNQDSESLESTLYTTPNNYKAMQYIWANNRFSKRFDASFLFLNNGKQASRNTGTKINYKDNYSQTAGTYLSYKYKDIKANASFYYQFGKDINVFNYWADPDIKAALFAAELSYQATEKLSLTAGYEYQSGQSQTEEVSYYDSRHAFTPFYGTNHKFNGVMDYFYVGNHIGSVGLQDIYIKAKHQRTETSWIGLDAHLFSAAADVLDRNELLTSGTRKAMDKYLGLELDLNMAWKLADDVQLQLGYSRMFGSETLAVLKHATKANSQGGVDGITYELSHWAWIMISVKPTFLKKN